MIEFGVVTQVGKFLGGQPRPDLKGAGPQRPHIFGGLPTYAKRFDLERLYLER